MKNLKNHIGLFFMSVALCSGVASCVSDEPFASDQEATLRMHLVINSDVTRAEVSDESLKSNCVVYISGQKGLLYKYKGLENLPEEISLKTGQYVAEAWTGDSVPASFTSRFYRGYQSFTVDRGVNQLVLKCGVRNAVVSVNEASIDEAWLKDYKITVASATGSLDFSAENAADAKGYYMLSSKATGLTYTITGKSAEGVAFTKKGDILGRDGNPVQPGHEYVLNFSYNPEYAVEGGAFITVTVDDTEILVEDEIEILGRPAITGADFDISKQVVGNAGRFTDKVVKVSAFGGVTSLIITSDAPLGLPGNSLDLMNLTASAREEINNLGLKWDITHNEKRNLTTLYLTFPASMLNRLPEGDSEYRISLRAADNFGKYFEQDLRLAVGEGAVVIDDPVVVAVPDESDMMAVLSRSVRLKLDVIDSSAANPGVEYRASDSQDDWTFVPMTRGEVVLSGLRPSTRYAVRAVAGDFRSEPIYVTTESEFVIPNASLESWSKYTSNNKVILPSADGKVSFWDTGNHGSATMSVTLTNFSTDMMHSGSGCAKLRSQFVGLGSLGKFAAGNLFAGTYLKTNGTNGEIEFGRQYDGSHPSALRVFANYRPAAADSKGANDKYIKQGSMDEGQIYVALSTKPVHVDTRYPDDQLFNPDAPEILAYGQVTWKSAFGPDGQLQELLIPIEYRAAASTQRPLYLIIVCSASKYGDYFCGGEGSTMYLDDFELIYE